MTTVVVNAPSPPLIQNMVVVPELIWHAAIPLTVFTPARTPGLAAVFGRWIDSDVHTPLALLMDAANSIQVVFPSVLNLDDVTEKVAAHELPENEADDVYALHAVPVSPVPPLATASALVRFRNVTVEEAAVMVASDVSWVAVMDVAVRVAREESPVAVRDASVVWPVTFSTEIVELVAVSVDREEVPVAVSAVAVTVASVEAPVTVSVDKVVLTAVRVESEARDVTLTVASVVAVLTDRVETVNVETVSVDILADVPVKLVTVPVDIVTVESVDVPVTSSVDNVVEFAVSVASEDRWPTLSVVMLANDVTVRVPTVRLVGALTFWLTHAVEAAALLLSPAGRMGTIQLPLLGPQPWAAAVPTLTMKAKPPNSSLML